MSFTDQHTAHGTKGAIHGALLTLHILCLVYNVCAYRDRKAGRLAVNAAVHAAAIGFETWCIGQHCERP